MVDKVLVTGVSGFIASHVAARLLEKGYAVRGTVRSPAKGRTLVTALDAQGLDVSKLEIVETNLDADKGWSEAVNGCRYILHIASPFPVEAPSDRESLVAEARAGAQRVLEHGLSAGVDRIVMTSSMVAMIGQPGRGAKMHVSETDWSDPDWKPLTAYPVSKTRAELSAWAYVEAQGLREKLVTICPGLVLGPDLYKNGGASLAIIQAIFKGDFPMMPKVSYPIIDVRDCAAIHIAALTADAAGGRRLMAGGETLWLHELSDILRKAYPDVRKMPKGSMPNFIVRLLGLFDDRIKSILPDLGIFHHADAEYVSNITKVVPRPAKEAILSSAQSLIENGVITIEASDLG